MAEDLPSEYDLIVLGTGLTESIVAAAAARVGKSVLHLDTNDYYGSNWAAFQLESLRKIIAKDSDDSSLNRTTKTTVTKEFDQTTVEILPAGIGIEHVEESWFDFGTYGLVGGWDQETILKENRKFSIDLTPKLLFAKGDMVALLISSNICRYVQFRAVDRVATIKDATIKPVPSSRADVFTNKDVTVVEKRLLMKFIEVCLKYHADPQYLDEFKGFEEKTFVEYLKHKKLTPNLVHYILYAIGMGTTETKCMEGVRNVAKFLTSIGHYGNTPFLFPMYGAGEIPQCFCRLCAVFAGIYCLASPIDALYFNKNDDDTLTFDGLQYEDRKLTSRNIVIGQGIVSEEILSQKIQDMRTQKCGGLSRAVFITATPIGGLNQNQGKNGVMFLKLPPAIDKNHSGAFVIQLDHHSGTCAKGLYLIHITCESLTTPKEDLSSYVTQILKTTFTDIKTPSEEEATSFSDEQPLDDETIPTILWSCYFHIPRCIGCNNQSNSKSTPSNVKLACGPFFELDFDRSINQAKEIFAELYPAEEFLPRAPDPDEIICEGEDPTVPKIELDPFLMETNETLEGNEAIEQAREAKQTSEATLEAAKEAEESQTEVQGEAP